MKGFLTEYFIFYVSSFALTVPRILYGRVVCAGIVASVLISIGSGGAPKIVPSYALMVLGRLLFRFIPAI